MSQLSEVCNCDFVSTDFAAPFEIMKFRLTYDGELRASGNKPRPRDKWMIRKQIHPQLAELWQTHTVLKRASRFARVPKVGGFLMVGNYQSGNIDMAGSTSLGSSKADLFAPISVGGFNFVPLVRESMHLTCGLDVVFMRKEEPGALVLQGGDIDNRIKTLFDALKMPEANDFGADQPDAGIDPFYTLLESDALITDCAIHTDRLLTRPGGNIHEVRLVIEVEIKVTSVGPWNMPFLGDP